MNKKNKLDLSKVQDGELIEKPESNSDNVSEERGIRPLKRLRSLLKCIKRQTLLNNIEVDIRGVSKRLLDSASPTILKTWSWLRIRLDWLLSKGSHESLRKPRAVLRITTLFLLAIFLWTVFFNIDQVVHAQGQIIANSRTQVIQAADGGVLTELLVQEGDEVVAGQTIAVLEKDRALAAFTESFGKFAALRLSVERLRAELAQTEPVFPKDFYAQYPVLLETQMNLFQQRKRGYVDQVKILEENVRLAAEELRMNIPLEKLGDISKVDILRLRRALNEAQSALVNYRTKYFQDTSTELNKAEEDLYAQEQSLKDRAQLLDHTNIVAPTAGIVKNIRVTTLGGVIRQGEELMHILPTESELILEAKVKPVDMAFLKLGLPAKVKLDAFDYSIFGAMNGRLIYISPDSLVDETKMGPETYYRVKVGILDSDQQKAERSVIEVKPGMTAAVDIKTDKRSVFSYLVKPLIKTLHTSMGEK